MSPEERIHRLEEFKSYLASWQKDHSAESRMRINQATVWVRREVIEARCYHTMTIAPPPAIGGLIMRNLDPFGLIFDPPYEANMVPQVVDMVDRTIGVLSAGPAKTPPETPQIQIDLDIRRGYAFVAMQIADDPQVADVLDAIKESANRCGILAERIDEPHSNERITDRILESIRRAEYVIVDLTGSKPNVFYEAGYAQGLKKTPIYVARAGTVPEFDLKDYPIIFFRGMKELKDDLEKRLRGLEAARKK